jgi:tetratricopeptide (TPR) repeat protein
MESPLLKLAEYLANEEADEESVHNHLLIPRDSYVKSKTEYFLDFLEHESKKNTEGLEKVRKILLKSLEELPEEERGFYEKECAFASQRMQDVFTDNNFKAFEDNPKLVESETWQDLLEFSDNTLHWIYELGRKQYRKGFLEDALAIFRFLSMINPMIPDYWTGTGFVQSDMGEDEAALQSLAMAIVADPENPFPRYRSAEIYIKLGQDEDALAELEVLSEIFEKEDSHSLKDAAKKLFDKLQNK